MQAQAGVTQMLLIGCDLQSSQASLELAKRHSLLSTSGIHPHDAKTADTALEQQLISLSQPMKSLLLVSVDSIITVISHLAMYNVLYSEDNSLLLKQLICQSIYTSAMQARYARNLERT